MASRPNPDHLATLFGAHLKWISIVNYTLLQNYSQRFLISNYFYSFLKDDILPGHFIDLNDSIID